ncbi:MAG: flagellar motor switch protein FliG [Spirochaetaceae bacterium]|nr:flagellar motor switch protein FliG [Spirochaetaceae bacterium]
MDRIHAYKKGMGLDAGNDDEDWLAKVVQSDTAKMTAEKAAAPLKKNGTQNTQDRGAPHAFVKVPLPPSKHERLAKFLALIGEEEGAKILASLPRAQAVILQKKAEELSELKSEGRIYGMTPEEAREIYEEFQAVLSSDAAVSAQQPLAFLEDFQPEQVALLLHKEGAQTCALVLARLPPKLAAGTLRFIEAEKKQDIAARIGRMKPVSPEVVCVIADTLRERARELGSAPGTTIDGVAALAEILKNTDVSFGDKIISSLAEDNPLLGRTLKERLYTLDDVCRADDKPIAEKLAAMSEQEIVLLIRGRPDTFVEKILSNLSAGRRVLVREENDVMGAVLKSDTEGALKDFLQWFRDKREKGEVLFLDDELVV